jgi:topoisomerase-4 subunit A
VIIGEKPHFVSISEILRLSTEQTMHLLKRELEIKKHELKEKLLYSSLEKIFIENRIYRDIEECETFEAVIQTIDKGLEPFKKDFYREIVEEDILRLCEIKIKRISKYDSFKADELMNRLEQDLAEVEDNLLNLVRYTINFFKDLLKKYSKGRERRTEIRQFGAVQATVVAANNQKMYVDRENGFIGYGLKKDEYVMDCSDIDDIIAFKRDGKYVITKIQEKVFVGKDIIYCSVFRKNDERKIYNVVYVDGKSGSSYAKRFFVTGITRDKEYDVSLGNPKSKVLYFTANDNGEAETVFVNLTANSTAKKKQIDWDFAILAIKNRSSMGNLITKFPVKKVILKSIGKSTLGGVDIWFDSVIGKLNRDEHGLYLGNFGSEDKILVLYKDGQYELTNYELTNRYEPREILKVVKFSPNKAISCLYFEGEHKIYYIKRFKIETTTIDKKFLFITDTKNSRLLAVSTDKYPRISLKTKADKKAPIETQAINVDEFVEVRGWKAIGQKLNVYEVVEVKMLDPKPEEVEVKPEVVVVAEVQSETQQEAADDTDNDGQLALF